MNELKIRTTDIKPNPLYEEVSNNPIMMDFLILSAS